MTKYPTEAASAGRGLICSQFKDAVNIRGRRGDGCSHCGEQGTVKGGSPLGCGACGSACFHQEAESSVGSGAE